MILSKKQLARTLTDIDQIKPQAMLAIIGSSDEGFEKLNDRIQQGIAACKVTDDKVGDMLYRLAGYGMLVALVEATEKVEENK